MADSKSWTIQDTLSSPCLMSSRWEMVLVLLGLQRQLWGTCESLKTGKLYHLWLFLFKWHNLLLKNNRQKHRNSGKYRHVLHLSNFKQMLWNFYTAKSNKWEKEIRRLGRLETHKDNFPEQSLQVHVFDPQFWDERPPQWQFLFFSSQQTSWNFEWLIWWEQGMLKASVSTENMSALQW